MPRGPVRASTIMKQNARKQLDADLPCRERELRRALRKVFLGGKPDLARVRRVFRKFRVRSEALRARVLSTLPRLTRLRFYCREMALPEPGRAASEEVAS